jgi:3-hydroxyisobutyrate dehydrogenase
VEEMHSTGTSIGLIGLGTMGIGMARNLLTNYAKVNVHDLNEARVAELAALGASAPGSNQGVMQAADTVVLSLPNSEVAVHVMENDLLAVARNGQVIIDTSTVIPSEIRRLSAAFAAKGVALLDSPVSGGAAGAESGILHIFTGGDRFAFEQCLPILECLGKKQHITYGGASGNGQILKSVNQMIMGLTNAAYLESLAFGVLAGIDAETVRQAMSGDQVWRKQFCAIADRVIAGNGIDIGVKFGQFPYFLQEAEEKGFELPLSKSLFDFCDSGERVVMEVNRLSPSFWKELSRHLKEKEDS